jgi:hypothetical protein
MCADTRPVRGLFHPARFNLFLSHAFELSANLWTETGGGT